MLNDHLFSDTQHEGTLWICVFFIISIYRRRILFFHHVCLFAPSIKSMWSSRFLRRLVLRTACSWYVRARNSLFKFCKRCGCAWVTICTIICLSYFHEGISSTPESLEPLLGPRTALNSGDEYCENNNSNNMSPLLNNHFSKTRGVTGNLEYAADGWRCIVQVGRAAAWMHVFTLTLTRTCTRTHAHIVLL